ncbi:plasmid partitioning protein RepB C-terminal domain-containing protein [Phyllobacterium myrsinacearum]|uniref:ParB family chromosome partitioning protein n=1 Tax=Phyllobacterium myrsinacearum TaxID=28101 RepID=A0A839EXA4_9HYPH|nr:plasmid partitioning protein RepB C-terminal domain-containing protein [Phyllobacterium myrsinacearum]MBA8882164.1 ParB family chromosome partitioning protein [Phyllobacterium myrsinacearum]
MKDESSEIRNIPINEITIINPRSRNKKIFNELVTSIANLGLKKPITVSKREDGSGYDLVCGQGRMEAFLVLGQSQIPAVMITATVEECYMMSLVENLARRNHSSMEFMTAIATLREQGYDNSQIAAKVDYSEEYIYATCYLLDHGEERLLTGVEKGIIPPSIAMEIARAHEADVQDALAEAYEKRTLPGNQVLAIRRIIDQRNSTGKSTSGMANRSKQSGKKVTAEALIRTYRKETERQKLLIKKAAVAQSRLLFVVNALRRLMSDSNFTTLLRAEHMITLPRSLAERVSGDRYVQ